MPNKKVFLIHGFEGTPNGGWRPWLMGELEKQDVYCCSLPMPAPEKPILSEWLSVIDDCVNKNKNDELYFVGHSLGATLLLRYFEKHSKNNIKGVILVSGPCEKTQNRKIDEFLESDLGWNKIKEHIPTTTLIHGDNDPYVPFVQAEIISKNLGIKPVSVENGGHLNGSAGFLQLPQVLDSLLEMMK
jgi:predicted alpha/beta hydrolase family esterase